MIEKVTVDVKLEQRDFNNYAKTFVTNNMRALMITVVFSTLILCFNFVSFLKNMPMLSAMIGVILVTLVGVLLIYWVFYKSKAYLYKGLKEHEKNAKYSFSKDSLECSNEKNVLQAKWKEFYKIEETEEIFLIYGTTSSHLIPKRCFKNKTEILAFREYAKSNFGDNAKLLSD